MSLIHLQLKANFEKNPVLEKKINQFENLVAELRKQELPNTLLTKLNKYIEAINAESTEKNFLKTLKKNQTSMLKMLEKELKVVPKFYYRNLWLAIGMAGFGIPLGVVFGLIIKNMAFISIGLPIGMAVGIAVGSSMDKKAFAEGRQLDIIIKD